MMCNGFQAIHFVLTGKDYYFGKIQARNLHFRKNSWFQTNINPSLLGEGHVCDTPLNNNKTLNGVRTDKGSLEKICFCCSTEWIWQKHDLSTCSVCCCWQQAPNINNNGTIPVWLVPLSTTPQFLVGLSSFWMVENILIGINGQNDTHVIRMWMSPVQFVWHWHGQNHIIHTLNYYTPCVSGWYTRCND